MKKLLSVILLLAMLVGCVAPSLVASAAGDAAVISVPETDEGMQGDESYLAPVTLTDLPCDLSYIQMVVFWDASYEVEEVGLICDEAVFDMDNSGAGTIYVGTNNKVKSILSEYGANTKSYKACLIDVSVALDEDDAYIPLTKPGCVGDVQFIFSDAAEADSTFEFQVALVAACDVDDEDVECDISALASTVTFKADPYMGKYDSPTLFIAPEEAEVEAGSTFKFDVRIDANPGIWGGSYFLVYPNTWHVTDIANGKIYPESAMTISDLDIDAAAEASKMLYDALVSYPDTVVEGYSFVKVFYMPDNDDDCFTNNGILNTFTVTVPEASGVGDFCIIYDKEGDFVRTEESGNVTVVFETVGATFTVTGGAAACEHVNTKEVVTKDPTCTETGLKNIVCEDCGETLQADVEVAKLGHNFGEFIEVVPAGCESDGLKTKYCSRCDATESEPIPQLGHNYVPTVTDPTCTEDGYTTYQCSRCPSSYKADYTDKLGHDWDEGVVTKAATETETGVMTYTCKRCTETYTEVIPVLGHTHDFLFVKNVPATCMDGGYDLYECRCSETEQRNAVAALGHDFTVKVDSKCIAPTCEDAGLNVFKCVRCEETNNEEVKPLGHDYASVVTAPTCEDGGYTTYTCKRDGCDYSFTADEKAALGHSITVKVDSECVAPTCEIDGYDVYKCVRCEERENRTVTHLGHLAGEWQVVTPATETAEGVRVKYCVREGCGIELERGSIPMLSFVSKATAKEKVSSISLTGDSIEITSSPNADHVTFSIAHSAGCTLAVNNAEIVGSGSTFKTVRVNNTVSSATLKVTDKGGNEKAYTVNVDFKTLTYEKYIESVSKKHNISDIGVDYNEKVISITSKPNETSVEFALRFESAYLKLSGTGYTLVSGGSDFAVIDVAKGDIAELILSDSYGNSETFDVMVDFVEISYEKYIESATKKHNISDIGVDYNEKVISITSKPNETYVEFALRFESAYLNLSGTGYTLVSGGSDFAVIDVAKGDNAELILSDSYGNSETFGVSVNFVEIKYDEYVTKAVAKKNIADIQMSRVQDEAPKILVSAKDDATSVDFAIKFESTNLKLSGKGYKLVSGGKDFAVVRVTNGAEEVELTLSDSYGNTETFIVDVTW